MQRATDLLVGVSLCANPIYAQILDRAHSAMEELCKLGFTGKPYWHQHKEHGYEILNDIEYLKQFGCVDTTLREFVKLVEVGEPQNLPSFDSCRAQNPMSAQDLDVGLQIESSRDSVSIYNISPINVVELLMDVNQWSMAFYNIVSRATILGSFLEGIEGSYDGKLNVISAEFHLPSPALPTRESYFARYCKQFADNKWAVVDTSLEGIYTCPSHFMRKRPSGCLIIGMPEGYTNVIWVEHVEADHSKVNELFKPLVTSGLAFGAPRWLASIVRHFEWSRSIKATKLFADNQVHIPQIGRTSFLTLADRLMRKFCANLSSTTTNPWMRLSPSLGSIDIRVRIEDNLADTTNKTVVFSTTIWLNVSPTRLFTFLRHQNSRNKWDILSQRLSIREFACMTTGEHLGNRVSLLQASTSKDKTEIFYLQTSQADTTGSYVIYAPLDEQALGYLAKGSNPDNVIVYPSGFAIIPGGLQNDANVNANDRVNGNSNNESLLTISFHLIDKATNVASIPPESAQTIHSVMTETVTAIKDAISCHTRLDNWVQDDLKKSMA